MSSERDPQETLPAESEMITRATRPSLAAPLAMSPNTVPLQASLSEPQLQGNQQVDGRAASRVVADRFLLGAELGTGGMATVYAAEDLRLRREIAIKMLHPHLRDQGDILSRFRAEARAVASLKHRHIVEVYDVASPEDSEAYMVAERIHGTTLRKLLRARGPFPAEIAGEMLLAVLSGLEAAHAAGMVHRDIKPENVMLAGVTDDGTLLEGHALCIKVMDFGIAKWAGASGMTVTGQMLGSPAHMAPEQIEGATVDSRTDVFAAGILLYELLTGELPFRGASPAQSLHRILTGVFEPADVVAPSVGQRWATLVQRALFRDPEQRFATASAFADAIRAECKGVGQADLPELAAYLADPCGFTIVHNARIVGALCERGMRHHRARDYVAAAQDINRAAALAPSDLGVMSVVQVLARSHSKAKLAGRLVRALLGLLAVVAFGIGGVRARQAWRGAWLPELAVAPLRENLVTENAGALQGVATMPLVREQALNNPASSRRAESGAQGIARQLRFGSVYPNAGVLLSVDGAQAIPVRAGESLPLTSGNHELKYSCVQDMCSPSTRKVAAGMQDVLGEVRLAVRHAMLRVEGDPNLGYSAVELPNLVLRTGRALQVPMSQGTLVLTVVQDATGARRDVILRAGKDAVVSF